MRRLLSILFLTLTFTLVSHKGDDDLETEKYLNFLASIENGSTFKYFTVIKVKDLNTGLTKEICTKGNFVAGALHIELKAGYEDKGAQKVLLFAKKHNDRYFQFKKKKKVLDNISFFEYNTKLVSKIQTEYDFEKTVALIKKNKKFV